MEERKFWISFLRWSDEVELLKELNFTKGEELLLEGSIAVTENEYLKQMSKGWSYGREKSFIRSLMELYESKIHILKDYI